MTSRSWATAGLVLGIAVGGFIDGIVAHQLLEWHHMLSAWHPPTTEHNRRINMIGDALFHLGCLLMLLVGIALLAMAHRPSRPGNLRRLAGWMLSRLGVVQPHRRPRWTTNASGCTTSGPVPVSWPTTSRSSHWAPCWSSPAPGWAFVVADVDGVVVLRWLCTAG